MAQVFPPERDFGANVTNCLPEGPSSPPSGCPYWLGRGDLPLIYLGWGRRDFKRDPLVPHLDRGINYYLLLHGQVVVHVGQKSQVVRGPSLLLFGPNCPFGLSQDRRETVEVLVWTWHGPPASPSLDPPPGWFHSFDVREWPLGTLADLHRRCRNEVSRTDEYLPHSLKALRSLIDLEILRAVGTTVASHDVQWERVRSWLLTNLSLHAPVPALCDYLGISPSTLRRFFHEQVGISPGRYFRDLKAQEARRLIHKEGWQVKAAAFHLGYRHANDLSRNLASRA